jgi:glucosamine--fructose-6-phosphate aminotransferase (isomerizing)
VASTKAYTTQIEGMILLALYLTQVREPCPGVDYRNHLRNPQAARQSEEILKQLTASKNCPAICQGGQNVLHRPRLGLGRSPGRLLKLKEISYIHAEAYAAGELKHGTLP